MNIHDPVFWDIKRKLRNERDALRLHHAQQVATLTGERDAARAECAMLAERVAGLEAMVAQLASDKAFYMGL